MPPTAVQINCPTCNAAQPPQPSGQYVCQFCLTPFTVQDATKEKDRLLAEIQQWLSQKVGTAALSPGAVDATSRGFIFREKVLPEIERDVNRALESFVSHGQFPLLHPPVDMSLPKGQTVNPLISQRQQILDMRRLRARLASEQVTSFAASPEDRAILAGLDRRMSDFIFLSNLAEATATGEHDGYQSARRNLESLMKETGERLLAEGSKDAGLAAFLKCLQERYRNLFELAAICEEITTPNPISGAAMADQLEQLAGRFAALSKDIEVCEYSPAETMPFVIGLNQDALACRLLGRWLQAYDALTARSMMAFKEFVTEIQTVHPVFKSAPPDVKVDLLDGCISMIRAMRGEVAVPVRRDFEWVKGWGENTRSKKFFFGLFGVEETVAASDQFLLPVWVAEVNFSATSGVIFTEGKENKCFALLDACAPSAERVLFVKERWEDIASMLERPEPLASNEVALPCSTAQQAQVFFKQASMKQENLHNVGIQVRGMAFIPAARMTFKSSSGSRTVTVTARGSLQLADETSQRVDISKQIVQRFG